MQQDFHFFKALPTLFKAGTQLTAVKSPITERLNFLAEVLSWAEAAEMPLFFWSAGFRKLQRVEWVDGKVFTHLVSQDTQDVGDILRFVCEYSQTGWFVLEGLLDIDDAGEISPQLTHQLTDTFYELSSRPQTRIVLLDEYVQLPLQLMALIPVLENPLPRRAEVQALVREFCTADCQCADLKPEALKPLVRASLGLPKGELQLILKRLSAECDSWEAIAREILSHKVSKLKGRGLEFISKPDVPVGGLDILNSILDRDAKLLDPEAAKYGLEAARGILLWGPPGTGKSLSAKHAALKMGMPLIAANWGSLRSPKPGQSEKNLDFLLQQCGVNAPVVLFFDDFEKGLAGWNGDAGGGVEGRLTNKFLTWMQEHVEPVYVIATCNRLEKLPPELTRRFDNIVFVDLPHAGARKEIFDIHLAKYFPAFRNSAHSPFTVREWRRLLKATHLCTAAEIAQIVRRAAQEAFYQGKPGECTLSDLLYQRSLMVPAMVREEEAILAIRNRAGFARPAASPDRSVWAVQEQQLFKYDSEDEDVAVS